MLYRPRLPSGKAAPLSWPIALYRLTNNICWPLEDNASQLAYVFDRFCWLLAFFMFVLTNDAELRYIRWNLNNLDEMLTGIPTYFVLIEIHLRAFTLGWEKEKFKKLLQKFYAHIYIEESFHPKIYQSIQRQLVPILIFSFFYLMAFLCYFLKPVYLLATGSRELMYKMIPNFDHTPLPIYLLCLWSNVWVGVIVTTLMFGEANTISTMIFHLNGRFLIMRENLLSKVDKLLERERKDHLAQHFHQILLETLRENIKLNKFAQDIQDEFSFRLFIILSFMAASLCALGFKVYTSPINSIGYMFWTVGKIQETIAFGVMGTSILTMTDQISSMYYESKWERVIYNSSDSKANVRILKLVHLAILTNIKPFYLTGLHFFSITLTSAVTILQGASSYFTCLISFH